MQRASAAKQVQAEVIERARHKRTRTAVEGCATPPEAAGTNRGRYAAAVDDSKKLELDLTNAMRSNLREIAKAIGPRTRFTPMLNEHGATETWRRLKRGPTTGFVELWEAGRLDLSLEALVVEHPKYHALFSDEEIAEMREELAQYGYEPRTITP
jgi:hypothetical protein